MDLKQSLQNAVRSAFCTVASPSAALLGLGGNIYIGLGGSEQGDDLIAAGNLLESAASVACNVQPTDVSGDFAPSFSGGQCPADYTVDWTAPPLSGNGSGPFRGPIGQFVDAEAFGGIGAAGVTSVNPGTGASQRTNIVFGNQTDIEGFSITGVTRTDGQPDDCGDAPPEPPSFDPNSTTTTTPVNYDDNNGNPVTINPTFSFKPVVDVGGGAISVPVEVTFEDGSVTLGDFNLSTGDVNFGVDNNNGDGVSDDPVELPEGEDPEENDYVVIGVRVVSSFSLFPPRATQRESVAGSTNLWVPRLGSIFFKYSTPTGGVSFGVDMDVKTNDCIIWAPQPAINFVGIPGQGVSFSLSAIVKKQTSEQS